MRGPPPTRSSSVSFQEAALSFSIHADVRISYDAAHPRQLEMSGSHAYPRCLQTGTHLIPVPDTIRIC